MGQPKPKRQHYVPQWHLRRFRDPSAKAGQHYVAAYDRQTNVQHQRIAVTNVAAEAGFYTMRFVNPTDTYKIEELLALRDESDSKLTARILERGKVADDDISEVKQLLAIQHFRTRWFRERLRKTYRNEEQPKLAAELIAEGPPPDWSDEDKAEFWGSVDQLKNGEWDSPRGEDDLLALQFGVDDTFLAELDLFRGFVLVVLINEAFVTSDNPIVAQRMWFPEWGPIMDIGLAHAGVLWFPLAPRRALMISRLPQATPTQIGLPVPQIRAINNALMRASDRWTIWQPGSPADQFLDLPETRTLSERRR